jgi:catechol 2,3-dioxygenase-like lactoylglutathione lyase family enzyme
MIHHLELNVSDLQKTITAWDWLFNELEYEVYQKWDKGISWKYDQTYIVFVQTEEFFLDSSYHRKRVGLNHLAFFAKSKQHVDKITLLLKEKGSTILYQDRHPYAGGPDHYAVFFEDPDRIKVEIVAPR